VVLGGQRLTVAKFLGKGNVSQNDFCNLARGYPTGYHCPNQAGQLQWVQSAFSRLGIRPGSVTSALSFATLSTEIDGSRPVETGIYWTAGGGHAQVIYGYDAASQTIYYGDPWPSSPRYSQFRWAESLYLVGCDR
jgi:hypothetical protein